MIVCLALTFAACKKPEAPVAVAKPPVAVPVNEDRQAWVDYLSDVVGRNMDGAHAMRVRVHQNGGWLTLPANSGPFVSPFGGEISRLYVQGQGADVIYEISAILA